MQNAERSRRRAFWALQVGGWVAYAASKTVAFPIAAGDVAWIAAKGIVLTCLLRNLLRRVERVQPATVTLLGAAVVLSGLLAAASLLLSHAASLRGWVLTAPGASDWLVSSEGMLFEFLVYMTWTALYLCVRYALALRTEHARLGHALAAAQHARARMLRFQLNPHFLFNALASLHALVREDAERARRVIDELSGFLRHSLLEGASDSTTLAREFEAARHYLAIQKVRFEERIGFDVSMDDALADVRVPAFLIQPLIENAVKYGMRTSPGEARVQVSARRHARACVLEVRNSGRWVEPGDLAARGLDGAGIGLANVRQRLEALGPSCTWSFHVGPDAGGVTARLVLDVA